MKDNMLFTQTKGERIMTNSKISGKTWVYLHDTQATLQQETIWTEEKYSLISKLAQDKMRNYGLPLSVATHKALWQVLQNLPERIIIYCNKVDEKVLGVIKYALTHGIHVALADNATGYKRRMDSPICLTKEDPSEATWDLVNEVMTDLMKTIKMFEMEIQFERVSIALRYHTRDNQIPAYSISKPLNYVYSEDTVDKMIQKLTKNNLFYGFNLQLEAIETDSMTYKPRHWVSKNTSTEIRLTISDWKYTNRYKKESNISLVPELLDAYCQQQYYLSVNENVSDKENVTLCPTCNQENILRTKRRNWELFNDSRNLCSICDTILPELLYETVSYDQISYKVEREDQEEFDPFEDVSVPAE